ncbi:MAG: hypothetical protein GTO60_16770 [Gammaproteobacteria bacterium]|nr:hypothetical protein [Gammaproteobacteria bacterium]
MDTLIENGLFEPENFARVFLRIKTKSMLTVPFVYNRVQRHFAARMTGRDIVLKARQHGISTFVQSRQEQTVMLNMSNAMTYADTAANAGKLRTISNRFYNQWPQEYLGLRPPRGKDSIREVTYPRTDSESIIATAGSKTAGRASTISHLHLSEFAFYEDPESVIGSAMQAATPDCQIVIESTPNGAQGLFYRMCMEAIAGDSEWTLHFYPWWWADEYSKPLADGEALIYSEEEPDLIEKAARNGFQLTPEQINWRRSKMSGEQALLFPQEYPEDIDSCFLSSGRGAFGNITHAIVDATQSEPIEGHFYVAGLDWGQVDDYTALSIIDMTDGVEVFIGRWRKMPYYDIRRHVLDACQQWKTVVIQAEKNAMTVNIEELIREIEERGLEIAVSPFTMTNDRKSRLVGLLRRGLHEEGLKLLRSHEGANDYDYALGELNSFVQKQTALGVYTYDHADGAKSDTVIARMLAYDYGAKYIGFW